MMESAPNFSFVKVKAPSCCNSGQEFATAENHVRRLTAEIRAGSEAAFEEFYSEYSPRLYRFLLVVTRGKEEIARELHQQVMIKTVKKMRVLNDERQLWAWLTEVARNCWKDYLRKEARDARLIEESCADVEISRVEADCELSAKLESAMKLLSDEEKALLEKFYYEELAQREICDETGRTIKAIQSELARIRKKLKAYLLKGL